MATTKKAKGYVIYDGPSKINGQPIVAIVIMKSGNVKTGNMASMYIMHRDIKPTEASKTGADEAVCGDCPMRHFKGGPCYVTLFQGPLAIFKAYKKGNYPELTDYSIFDGMKMRFGSYGDPYALPVGILLQIKSRIANNTSYTHQWRQTDASGLMSSTMASADSKDEAIEAQSKGWRTFRVTNDESDLLPTEIVCPNYTHDVQCVDCGLCKGGDNGKSIVIPVHGAKKSKFKEV